MFFVLSINEEFCKFLSCWHAALPLRSHTLLYVTVHLCKCTSVRVGVCSSMFESCCVLWSDRLQWQTGAAVNLFHWNELAASHPHGRSHIPTLCTITLTHSPLARFNKFQMTGNCTETFAHGFQHTQFLSWKSGLLHPLRLGVFRSD